MSLDEPLSKHPDPKDWVIIRQRHDRRHVLIRHSAGAAASAWIAKLRNTYKSLQHRRPSDLLEEVRRTGEIDLGLMAGREAHSVTQLLKPQGFDILVEDASYISHFPTVAGTGLIIEDQVEAEAFCMKLIAAGATVQEVEE